MSDTFNTLSGMAFKEQFSNSPHLLSFLDANFSGPDKSEAWSLLLSSTDESSYSLRQWVEALKTLRDWLDARGLEMATMDEVGYVCCAGAAAGAGANLSPLPGVVAEMLEAYGCELAKNKT